MANAKRCDRCGKFYQEVDPNGIEALANAFRRFGTPQRVLQQIYVIEKFLDLCPSCSESLKRWAKGNEDPCGINAGFLSITDNTATALEKMGEKAHGGTDNG